MSRWITHGFIVGLSLLAGCGEKQLPETDVEVSRKSDFGYQTSVQTTLVFQGRNLYQQYCIGCHGERGDGLGDAARYLNPKPRDFVAANFKFSSTRSGQLPTDMDLFRTITNGLRGSSMPPWNLLPERDRWALVAYIKTLSPKWKDRGDATRIPEYPDPYRENPDKSAAIARGQKVYHGFFRCWSCHPAYVDEAKISEYIKSTGGVPADHYRPNLGHADVKATSEGETIFAPDFLRDYVRAGWSIPDLYRSIAAGITGTAMPTWIDIMTDPPKDDDGNPIVTSGDLWAMAYYVQYLIKQRTNLLPYDKTVARALREIQFADGGARFVHKVPGLTAEEEEEE